VLSPEDLKVRLAEIKELEDTARRELRNLKGRQEHIAELERDRDALLKEYVGRTLEALDSLTSEQRHQV
jgi:flagellar motility protein MotE (MotC chaperone)